MEGKMRRIAIGTSLFLVISLIFSCASLTQYGKLTKSAESSFQTKNYDSAFNQCISAIRINPDYGKAQILLQDIFRVIVVNYENIIQTNKNSSDKFKYDKVVEGYERLSYINGEIKTLPTLIDDKTQQPIKFVTKEYSRELGEAKELAAEAHYQEGLKLSLNETLDAQKAAAKEFKTALKYVDGYKDAGMKYETCRKAGIKRIAVIPFDNKSGKIQYGAVEEMISDQVISQVMHSKDAMEFLEIISRDQLNQIMQEQHLGLSGAVDEQTAIEIGRILGVHELLTGKITQITYTSPNTSTTNFDETERVIVGEETYYDKDGKKKTRAVWGDVSVTVMKYIKTASASINGSYNIIDVKTALVKKSESFKGEYNYYYEWGKYRGNEKALSKSSNNLCAKPEGFPPGEDEMVNLAAENLSRSLASTLIAYAK